MGEPGYMVQVKTEDGTVLMPRQRQDSLHDQLIDLIQLATSAGMYDAADWLRLAMGIDD